MEKVIPIDIYNTDLLFVVGSKQDLKDALKKHLDMDDAEDAYDVMVGNIEDYTLGRSAYLNSGQLALWLPDASDKATLAHEIFHVACYLMEKVGIGLCHESDEAYAYLIGYITKKVDELLIPSSDDVLSQ